MQKFLTAVLLAVSVSPAFSFDLQTVSAQALKDMPPAPETPAVPAARAASQYLWLSVRSNPSFKEAEAADWGARIEARVTQSGSGFGVNLRSDSDYSWASINKGSGYYSLFGGGLYLNMSGSNGSYFISGNVTENGKTSFVSVNVSRRFDDFSFSVFGSGLNLYTDRNSMNGNFDPDRVSKKAVAAVTALLLAVQLDAQPAARAAPAGGQRVWLTIGPGFGGWNLVEARDPWARIEVGLRKVFDREYDADISVDGNRRYGRVSGFFADRYELTAGATDLRMERWAGSWQLTGRVEAQGAQNGAADVRLDMRDRFGDGSFYIWQNGVNLNIDRNGISGDVDTKLYPKEVVAAIASLVMAWQQDNQPVPAPGRR